MLAELSCRLLSGPTGRHGCSMSRLARCPRPQGGVEQCECIFVASLDLVWICVRDPVSPVDGIRVGSDERTFDWNQGRDPSGFERHHSILLLIRRVRRVATLLN